MRKHILATASIFALLITPAAAADFYIGGLVGYGGSDMDRVSDSGINNRVYPRIDKHQHSFFGGAYVGAGAGPLAVEIGALKLPYYHSSVKGLFPTREGNQTIDGTALFARGVVRIPPQWGWTVAPYVFGGAARVKAYSRERVYCADCVGAPGWGNDGWADYYAPLEPRTRPYVGIGAELPVYGPVSARLEIGYIEGAIDEFHTGRRNYTLGSAAFQWRF